MLVTIDLLLVLKIYLLGVLALFLCAVIILTKKKVKVTLKFLCQVGITSLLSWVGIIMLIWEYSVRFINKRKKKN